MDGHRVEEKWQTRLHRPRPKRRTIQVPPPIELKSHHNPFGLILIFACPVMLPRMYPDNSTQQTLQSCPSVGLMLGTNIKPTLGQYVVLGQYIFFASAKVGCFKYKYRQHDFSFGSAVDRETEVLHGFECL